MKLIILCIAVLIIPFCFALNAALFVEFPNGTESRCVSVIENSNAKDVLDASGFDVGYKYLFGFVNSINNLSCAKDKCWFFYHGDNLKYSNEGIKQYKVLDKDVLYFGYYSYGSDFLPEGKPGNFSFDACSLGKKYIEKENFFSMPVAFLVLIAVGIALVILSRFIK